MPHIDWEATARRHLERAELAEEELRQFKEAIRTPALFPPAWRLDRTQAAILTQLAKHKACTRQHLFACTRNYSRPDGPDPKIVDVYICHLRRKLRNEPVKIENARGIGFFIDQKGRDYLRKMME